MADKEIREITINLLPEQAEDKNYILKELQKHKGLKDFPINDFRIIRRSIDARKSPVKINLGILVSNSTIENTCSKKTYNSVTSDASQVIIVGAGPAGLFAGLKALEYGLKPIIIERGKDVDARKIDITSISRDGKINEDSNYCFGEGGAGTFSDGKLFTRSKKRGSVSEVLEILCQFGASEDILINSHPHIGSDKLPKIIKSIREKIKECGGEVKFNTRMEDLIIEGNTIKGIKTSTGETIEGPVFLAIGHSARDTVRMLYKKGVDLEPKGIAIGVRLEHPQLLIDKMQYHSEEGRGRFLPPAEYSFVNQADGRGVYSFCMCPGGVIVPAVSKEGQIVVNGMSASARSGKWANSGYVVELHPGDIKEFANNGVMEMMDVQENLERKFYDSGNHSLAAPAQKINDFIKNKISTELPKTSYAPGIIPQNFNDLFPKEISTRLKKGLLEIGKRNKDFISDAGIMIGLESRTSSPIRIPRNKETFSHIKIKDLYPVGEGAGYSGGIVSSAIDGMQAMNSYVAKLQAIDKDN